jgi:hypothetical protein
MSVAEWETKDKNRLRKWLGEHLAYGPVTVVFEKKDGTLREMRCTLKDVPQYERKTESETTRKKNDEVMSVYDMDKSEWRSFRIDSIKEIKFDLTS